jgi:inorganic pyrophosphatase
LKEIETFFATYKLLEPKDTEILGWHHVDYAWKVIAECEARNLMKHS